MPRQHKIWYRKEREVWRITIGKVRHNLGPDKEAAEIEANRLIGESLKNRAQPGTYAAIAEQYLEWAAKNTPASVDWYQERIQKFLDWLGERKTVHVWQRTHDLVLSFTEDPSSICSILPRSYRPARNRRRQI